MQYPGAVLALDPLDRAAGRDEILGVLGPTGLDKSTAAGILTGCVGPTAGRAFVGVRSFRHRVLS